MSDALLAVEGLSVRFPGDPDARTADVLAVDDVSLTVRRGEIHCVVGESGAGKSTVATAVLGLIDRPGQVEAGRILFDGVDLARADEPTLRRLRGRRIGAIFQDPLSALNPVLTIADQMLPALGHATGLVGRAAVDRAADLLERVAIDRPRKRLRQYPHELSGGMRQRVVIAIAISGSPDLLVADEPTTALDVSIQSGVLRLIEGLVADLEIGVLLITHDMAVVAEVADRVTVMRHGRVVEEGPKAQVLFAPRAPYTCDLIAAVPRADVRMERFRGPEPTPRDDGPILSLSDVTVVFRGARTLRGGANDVRAVDGVSLDVARGEAFGLVGESGSGKSTLARVACGLQGVDGGTVTYDGRDITRLAHDRSLRRDALSMQMIFQDPFASLNPRQKVIDALTEPQAVAGRGTREERRARAIEALKSVGLDEGAASKHPHAFSGGQRQRISIARALVMEPAFLICDEPTSALDVSVQAQVLEVLNALRQRLGLTLLFISHDLAVVRQLCDRIAVMRSGQVREVGPTEAIFEAPQDAYTRELLRLAPKFQPDAATRSQPAAVSA
ncbi:dipeptide ABC transporter ATP-binding protein [Acuticoccus sp.]|uniref:dipeptide ABC transporter ATP-binding protein n=1 Tax=Acuticoccus sp. TaxID=1904378 RepID=UPI003B51E641